MSTDLQPSQPTIPTINTTAKGFEEPTPREDLIIPRAKLLQALSPEVVEGRPDCRPGVIVNSVTSTPLPARFVPVFKFTQWLRFNPRNQKDPNFDGAKSPGALLWRSTDPYDPRVQREGAWGPNGEKPLALKCLSFFARFDGLVHPVIVPFAATSYKAGKQLLSIAHFAGVDMFARAYKLGARSESNDMGTYFVLTVTPDGAATETEAAVGARWWEEYRDRRFETHAEDMGTDTDATIDAPPF